MNKSKQREYRTQKSNRKTTKSKRKRKKRGNCFSTKGLLHLICSRLNLTANQTHHWSVELKFEVVRKKNF